MKLLSSVRKFGIVYGYLQRKFVINQPVLNRRTFTRFHLKTPSTDWNAGSERKNKMSIGRMRVLDSMYSMSLRTTAVNALNDTATITFVDRNGEKMTVKADIGDSLLDVAKDNDIDGVEGACGGTLACSTCHCIFHQDDFHRLQLHDVTEDELDMLDLAYGLTDTSRLVCALEVTEEMDGLEIFVPVATNDARDV